MMNFLGRGVVVGIIERSAVGKDRPSAADGVVEDALHAVAVAGVARDAHEIAGDFEVSVSTAWCFEAGMTLFQTGMESAAARHHEGFIGSPASSGETLFLDHAKTIGGGAQ